MGRFGKTWIWELKKKPRDSIYSIEIWMNGLDEWAVQNMACRFLLSVKNLPEMTIKFPIKSISLKRIISGDQKISLLYLWGFP